MENKKTSFILYTEYNEQLQLLSMEQRGILLTALMNNQLGKDLPEMDDLTIMCYSFISADVRRNNEKYNEIIEKRREAGSKGGKQTQANLANARSALANQASSSDNDNGSDNGSDNDNDNGSDNGNGSGSGSDNEQADNSPADPAPAAFANILSFSAPADSAGSAAGWTMEALRNVCLIEKIILTEDQLKAIRKELKAKRWKFGGRKIESIGKVLRWYSKHPEEIETEKSSVYSADQIEEYDRQRVNQEATEEDYKQLCDIYGLQNFRKYGYKIKNQDDELIWPYIQSHSLGISGYFKGIWLDWNRKQPEEKKLCLPPEACYVVVKNHSGELLDGVKIAGMVHLCNGDTVRANLFDEITYK